MLPKKTSWGTVADWYDEMLLDSNSYQKQVIMPNIMRIINPRNGMSIIDIACGQGYFSHAFAENGAKVIGCDISKELIEIAKKNSIKGKEIEYFVSSSDNLPFMNGESRKVDFAVLILSLQNIENLSGTLSECARILKPDGRLVIVLNHPAFRIPKNSSWEWNEQKQYRRIDAYMSDQQFKIDMTPGEADPANKKFTVSFHRPLQTYFKALIKSGLSVVRLEEWISHKKSQTGPRAVEEDRLRKEIPMFICIEAKKLDSK
ncbi:MAG: methyltransferase domain-containing protein [Candidatus Paceibacterota bacterium]|jgi:ubiquinone/menaquinone biosynthesis C-methylase UbiE